jgi:hypothetical protein
MVKVTKAVLDWTDDRQQAVEALKQWASQGESKPNMEKVCKLLEDTKQFSNVYEFVYDVSLMEELLSAATRTLGTNCH